MGLEPTFLRQAWPHSGLDALPLEPEDPRLGFSRDLLQIGAREAPQIIIPSGTTGILEARADVPLAVLPKPPRLGRKWKLALLASCVLHAAIAAFFIVKGDDAVLIEGSQDAGLVILGNASEDDLATGEPLETEPNVASVTLITLLDATPVETVDAQAIAETVDAVDMPAAEILEPVEDTASAQTTMAPAETVVAETATEALRDRPSPAPSAPAAQPMTEIVPEILTTDKATNVDNVVQPPPETNSAAPLEPIQSERAATAETAPTEQLQVETAVEAQDARPAAKAEAAPAQKAPTERVMPAETTPVERTEAEVEVQAPDAKPTDTAEAVPVKPTETVAVATAESRPTETAQPVIAEVTPTLRADEVEPAPQPDKVEPVTEPEQELAAKPEPTAVDEADAKPEPRTSEKAKPKREAKKAVPEKAETKATEKPAKRKETKSAAKAEAKATGDKATKGGAGGKGKTNAKRGVADGDSDGKVSNKGKGGKGASGNAAVSNYPGKVVAKLRRSLRGIPRSAIKQARNDVQVGFTVSANGGVSGVRITRSSGSAALDQHALAIVRRAAPFPPIPADAGRSTWAFAVPLGVR